MTINKILTSKGGSMMESNGLKEQAERQLLYGDEMDAMVGEIKRHLLKIEDLEKEKVLFKKINEKIDEEINLRKKRIEVLDKFDPKKAKKAKKS